MSKPKLLITGASGFLGYHLVREAAKEYEVFAIYHAQKGNYESAIWLQCDIANYIEVGNLAEDIEPSAIIHAAALCNVNFCEQHPAESAIVNVDATTNLAGVAADFNIPFVFTSTDLVFDGEKGNYNEDDAVNPINKYGEQKALAEETVLSVYPNVLVARLPLMFGNLNAGNSSYLAQLVAENKAGKGAQLFFDEFRSVCGAYSVAKGLLQLMETANGVVHLGGAERMSRLDFGMRAAAAFHLDKALIHSASQSDFTFAAKRPKDVSLDISKALSLGYDPQKVEKELAFIAAQQ